MRLRLRLCSSAVAIAVLAALAMPAYAQKGPFLKPTTQWSVAEVESKEPSVAGYCTLARRFSERTVLTMALNKSGETSLAVDFQSPRLKPRETMAVILDPGAGEQRNFDVVPASASAFVVRLGDDDAFFAALSRTGMLRLEMDEQLFHFDLSDIDSGKKRLQNCVDSIEVQYVETVPAVPPQPVSGAAAPGDSESAAIPDVKINALQAENDALKLALAEARTSLAQLEDQSPAAQDKPNYEGLQAENERMRKALEALNKKAEKPLPEAAPVKDVVAPKAAAAPPPVPVPVQEAPVKAAAKIEPEKVPLPLPAPAAAVKMPPLSPAEMNAREDMTEAQRQEADLQRSMALRQPPAQDAPALPDANAEAPIELSRSEDPFADLKPVDDFKGYAAKDSAVAAEQIREPKVASAEKPQAALKPLAAAQEHAAQTPSKGFDLSSVLDSADIVQPGAVSRVEGLPNASLQAYQWQTDSLFGSAEIVPMPDVNAFENNVKEYFEKTQQRCEGDFAIAPADTQQQGATRVDSYEIACVGKSISSSVSLLFVAKDGIFAAVAHEAATNDMGSAMDARDRLAQTIIGGQKHS